MLCYIMLAGTFYVYTFSFTSEQRQIFGDFSYYLVADFSFISQHNEW